MHYDTQSIGVGDGEPFLTSEELTSLFGPAQSEIKLRKLRDQDGKEENENAVTVFGDVFLNHLPPQARLHYPYERLKE